MARGRSGGRSSRSFSSARRHFNLRQPSYEGIGKGLGASASSDYETLLDRMTPDEKCKMFFKLYVEVDPDFYGSSLPVEELHGAIKMMQSYGGMQDITMIGKDSFSAVHWKKEMADCPAKYLEELRRFDSSKLAREAPLVKDNVALNTDPYEKMSLKERCATLSKIYKETIYDLGENSYFAAHVKEQIAETCTGETRI